MYPLGLLLLSAILFVAFALATAAAARHVRLADVSFSYFSVLSVHTSTLNRCESAICGLLHEQCCIIYTFVIRLVGGLRDWDGACCCCRHFLRLGRQHKRPLQTFFNLAPPVAAALAAAALCMLVREASAALFFCFQVSACWFPKRSESWTDRVYGSVLADEMFFAATGMNLSPCSCWGGWSVVMRLMAVARHMRRRKEVPTWQWRCQA